MRSKTWTAARGTGRGGELRGRCGERRQGRHERREGGKAEMVAREGERKRVREMGYSKLLNKPRWMKGRQRRREGRRNEDGN